MKLLLTRCWIVLLLAATALGATEVAYSPLDQYEGDVLALGKQHRSGRRSGQRQPAGGHSFNRPGRASPNQQFRVIIDAGHGGEDYGTYSNSKPRQHEKYLTLATAFMVRDHLTKMGYQVIMTRTDDTFIELGDRVTFAGRKHGTLFVSLHYNSAPSKQAHGIEVFYYKPSKASNRTQQSNLLAEKILNRTLAATKAKSRGVKHGNFKVIRETGMPSVLVEGGFLTNEAELQKLKNPAYLNRIAKAVALGIDDYVKGG